MKNAATPFLFGDDLRRPAAARPADDDLARIAEEERHRAALEQAAFERGRLAGRMEAEGETARLQALSLDRIAAEFSSAIGSIDSREAAIENEAAAFFEILARRLAARALERAPLEPIREAAAEAFRHLRGVPHLVARVHESLVEDVDAALRKMGRETGFDGRMVVIGAEDIPQGDARLEWADGAVVADRAAREAAIEDVLARIGPTQPMKEER